MTTTLTERFRFFSPVQTEKPFHVVRFSGVEGLHRLFDFHIDLVSADAAVDTGKLLAAPCRFEVLRDGDAAPAVFSGYPACVEQRGFFNGYAWYAVHLRPAFWKLSQIRQSAIFLNKNLEDVLRELMQSQPFFQFPHEFRLMAQDYPRPEFAMQYQESLYDYMCWRMEEQGAYFYCEEKDGTDTVIFADTPQSHSAEHAPRLRYAPASGLEGDRREEVIVSFSLAQTPLPRRVALRSYDWRNPNRPVVGIADVDTDGLGDVYLSNEYVDNDAEAARLATIRAQELRCRGRLFHGTSSVPVLRPGRIFRLDGHYNEAFNRDYLVTEITHEGRQDAYLSLGLGIPLQDADEHLYYRNTFTCMEADIPYRPARTAPRNHISGVLRAFVAGDGSGARAEMDNYGRYKLHFPFDISGRTGGNGSCWIRRAQPQIGKDSGLSLPLQPGTEVLVSFVDGNPDLPVIAGALANGETGSISGAGNANIQGLRTAGGNQITINDTDNKQGISLSTPAGGGLTVSAGSTESALLNSAHIAQVAGASSTQLASFGLSQFSGFKVSSGAFRFDKTAYWSALCASLGNVIGAVTSTLSSQSSDANEKNGLDWGTTAAKLLTLISNATGDMLVGLGTKAIPYGGALVAQDDMAKSLLQVKVGLGEMLSAAIPYFAGRVASLIADSVAIGTEFEAADPNRAYQQALEDAMVALYDYNNTDYAKYSSEDSRKTCLDSACEYYSEVYLELGEVITDLSKDETTFQQKLQALNTAEQSYKTAQENYKEVQKKREATPPTATEEELKKAEEERNNAATKVAEARTECNNAQGPAHASNAKKADFESLRTRLETTWNACCNRDEAALAYYENKKQECLRSYLVNSLAALGPEIVSLVLFYRGYTHASRLGGILLRAQDNNITMTAQTSIAQHAQRCILRNTRDLPEVDPNEALEALGTIHNFTQAEKAPALGILSSYENRPQRTGMDAAAYWGVKIALNDNASDFMAQDLSNLNWSIGGAQQNGNYIRERATFIADTTELHYMRNRWSFQRSEENSCHISNKDMTLKGGDGSLILTTEAGRTPAVSLTTQQANGRVRLSSQGIDDNTSCTDLLLAHDQLALGLRQQLGDQNYKASFNIQQNSISMKMGNSLVSAAQDATLVRHNTATISCRNNEITMTAPTINLGDVQISGTKINAAAGKTLDIHCGAIKIVGGTATINGTDIKKQCDDLARKIDDQAATLFSQSEARALQERLQKLEQDLQTLQNSKQK